MNARRGLAVLAVVVTFGPTLGRAQSAGREPAAGQPTSGGATSVDTQNPVTSSGVLRLWRAYSTRGGRVMLKVYRPEGARLVLIGTSALEQLPAGHVAVFPCSIPVARNDLIGCFCPDDICVDRFSDGRVLTLEGDSGTRDLDDFQEISGGPAIYAGTSFGIDIPSTASSNLVLPVAARTAGLHGTWWTTSLELFNTASDQTTVALFFNRSDEDNTAPAGSAQVQLPPRATVSLEDVVGSVFGLDDGTGSVDIVASAPVIAHARVWTPGENGGTYGQLVPAFPQRWAVGDDDAPGVNPLSEVVYLFELEEDDDFRSNLGVVNVSAVPLTVELRASDGRKELGEPLVLELLPYSHTQVNHVLLALNLGYGSSGVRVEVAAVEGATGRFLAYASRVDNRTGDAVYLAGSRESALAD